RTPSFAFSASWRRCILHGFPSNQTLAMPTCGFFKSSSESPVACNIACDAPWDLGDVIFELNLFRSTVILLHHYMASLLSKLQPCCRLKECVNLGPHPALFLRLRPVGLALRAATSPTPIQRSTSAVRNFSYMRPNEKDLKRTRRGSVPRFFHN